MTFDLDPKVKFLQPPNFAFLGCFDNFLYLQVHTGATRRQPATAGSTQPPQKRRMVDADVGFFVVFEVMKDDPEVGKVVAISPSHVDVHIYRPEAGLRGIWVEASDVNGVVVTKRVASASLKDQLVFSLTSSQKLPGRIVTELKKLW